MLQYSNTDIAIICGCEDFRETTETIIDKIKQITSAIGEGLVTIFNKLSFIVAKLSKKYDLLFNRYYDILVDNRHSVNIDELNSVTLKVVDYNTLVHRLNAAKYIFSILENIDTVIMESSESIETPQLKRIFALLIELGVNINKEKPKYRYTDNDIYSQHVKKEKFKDHGYTLQNTISLLKDIKGFEKYTSKVYVKSLNIELSKLTSTLLQEATKIRSLDHRTKDNKKRYTEVQVKIMRAWWCASVAEVCYHVADDITNDLLTIVEAIIKFIPSDKLGSVFGASESFMTYYNTNVDNTYETTFSTTIEKIYNELQSPQVSKLHSHFVTSKLKDEEYRAIKKFIKSWSKHNKDIFNTYIKDSLEQRNNDFTISSKLKKLNTNKVLKQDFKNTIVNDTTTYVSMNARIVLYNSIINAVNSIDKVITEDDSYLGNTLTKLLTQLDSCGYIIDIVDKNISDYPSYVDIKSAFNTQNKSLKDLDFTPNDVFRFATSMDKLKTNIYKTGLFLQDRLKTQHNQESNQSENTTITGLLYYNLPNTDNVSDIIKTRLFRVALLNSIFQTVCNYSFEVDYNSTINLLNTTISLQDNN